MNKFLITTGCVMALSISSLAYSAEGPYVRGNLGFSVARDADIVDLTPPVTISEVESDTGLVLGVAAGYGFANNFRVEGEVAYQRNGLDTMKRPGIQANMQGDTSSLALLLNGYYDFVNQSAYTPFVSAGAGFAKVEINDMNIPFSAITNLNDDDTAFAYQLGAGVAYALNEKVNLDLTYRYFQTEDLEFANVQAEYASHNVYAGVRIQF